VPSKTAAGADVLDAENQAKNAKQFSDDADKQKHAPYVTMNSTEWSRASIGGFGLKLVKAPCWIAGSTSPRVIATGVAPSCSKPANSAAPPYA
jgi:hypothetical protein